MNLEDEASTWRDLTDPRRADYMDDLEEGLKSPKFESLDIPETFGPVKLCVDDHKVKRFAFTHDDYHPWHFSDSPFGGRIGHAGLLGNDLLQLFTTRYAASQVVGLHTEEQLWFDSPVGVGEAVTLSGQYTEAYERRGQGYVVMEAAARGADGRTIIRHRGVEILRTIPGSIAGRGSSAASEESQKRVTGEVPPGAPVIVDAGDPVQLGSTLQPLSKVITQEQASVFSRAGEYVRNIHNDLDIARRAGLRLPIVQGQQQVGILTELMTRAFGADWFTAGWMKVKFLQPVTVFEPLIASGIITELIRETDNRITVVLEIWLRRSDGRLSAAGWARCTVSSHSPRFQNVRNQSLTKV